MNPRGKDREPAPSEWEPDGDVSPSKPWGMRGTVDKSDLVAAIAAETGENQATVGRVIDAFFGVVAKQVGGGKKVSIPGWVSFEKTHRSARKGRNPATGESINIAASNSVKVSTGSKLKNAVN